MLRASGIMLRAAKAMYFAQYLNMLSKQTEKIGDMDS